MSYLPTAGVRGNPRRLTQIARAGWLTRKQIDRAISRWRILTIISAFPFSTFRAEWGQCISPLAGLEAACSSAGPSAPRQRGGRGPGLADATGYTSIDMAQYSPSIPAGRIGKVWVKCNQSPTTPGSKKWGKRAPLYRDVWVWPPPRVQSMIGAQKGNGMPSVMLVALFGPIRQFPYHLGRVGADGYISQYGKPQLERIERAFTTGKDHSCNS